MTSDRLCLIEPDSILFSLESTTREDAYAEMLQHLIDQKLVPRELFQEILDSLEAREKKMSTAIGRELAIPHAAIHDLPAVVRLFARCPNGIPSSSSDGLPIRYFYLSLIPDNDYSTHLRTIASISSFFREDANLDRLKAASSLSELLAVFTRS
ncbi:MAG: PTS sugar transporter subunit IIA [Verrucomicrobiota bacterium]